MQICHGMVEYIKRYDEFAEFLCGKGFYVVGNDHLGHGKSVQAKSEYGFFSEKYGNACVYRRYSYTSAEDDEEISERSVFYARTQYGVFAFASVYSDVRQGIERGDHYGRGCDHKKGDACVREALMQADGGCARLALQKSFCGSFSCGKF